MKTPIREQMARDILRESVVTELSSYMARLHIKHGSVPVIDPITKDAKRPETFEVRGGGLDAL